MLLIARPKQGNKGNIYTAICKSQSHRLYSVKTEVRIPAFIYIICIFLGTPAVLLWGLLLKKTVSPSIHKEQIENPLTDVHEILYLGVLLEFGKVLQFWLKPDKNNRLFTWRSMQISALISSVTIFIEAKNALNKSCGEKCNKGFLSNILFP
jgi:hypothetical protein